MLIPSRRVRRYVSRLLLGNSFDKVHRVIDLPYGFLGKKHRILLHDPISAVLIASTTSTDEYAFFAGLAYVAVDVICSRNRTLREPLELMARLDSLSSKASRVSKVLTL